MYQEHKSAVRRFPHSDLGYEEVSSCLQLRGAALTEQRRLGLP